ncbi:MAG: histone deacetylase [Ignavibacteriae bacterium]|nr:histone deacetylase [Ignavibacteriota bacterium]
MKRVGFLYSEEFLRHRTPDGHPERADRLRCLIAHLRDSDLWQKVNHVTPNPASLESILEVHSREYLNALRATCARGGGLLDEGDTFVVKESFKVAMQAAGAVCTAIDAIVADRLNAAFCAVRPPGHHAERRNAMGFCLINNVAVGARYAQRVHGKEKIAILDWDVHHGNGTQHAFEDDASVFYISLHQFPFYPGTGARNETGIGEGKGFTLNVPLPAGTGEVKYLAAFEDEIVPTLQKFKPDLLIISAGFDAHKDDPIGGMKLTEDSFAKMTDSVKGIAPIVSVLEGGYNLEALAKSVEAHVRALD